MEKQDASRVETADQQKKPELSEATLQMEHFLAQREAATQSTRKPLGRLFGNN